MLAYMGRAAGIGARPDARRGPAMIRLALAPVPSPKRSSASGRSSSSRSCSRSPVRTSIDVYRVSTPQPASRPVDHRLQIALAAASCSSSPPSSASSSGHRSSPASSKPAPSGSLDPGRHPSPLARGQARSRRPGEQPCSPAGSASWWPGGPTRSTSPTRTGSRPASFGIFGIVPFGYALFAFALGVDHRRPLSKDPSRHGDNAGRVRRGSPGGDLRPPPLRFAPFEDLRAQCEFPNSIPRVTVVLQNPTIPNAWVRSTVVVDNAGRAPTTAFLDRVCPGIDRRRAESARDRCRRERCALGADAALCHCHRRQISRRRYLPARKPLLAVPDLRDCAFRRARPGARRGELLVGSAAADLTGRRFTDGPRPTAVGQSVNRSTGRSR